MANEKILIIDTEKNVLLNYKNSLEAEGGYHVDIAMSEDEARKKLSKQTYPIVVTEFYLKGLNTLNLIQSLKNNTPGTYVIITTSQSLPLEIYSSALEAGAQDYFLKPFPVENLLLNIRKGLRRKELYTEKKILEEKLHGSETFFLNQEPVICNPLYFLKALRQELKRADRFKHTFSLMIIESDFFIEKGEFPDSYHKYRDEFAKITLSTVRQTDTVAQNNGSFSFILPETPKSSINHLAERLQKKIIAEMTKNEDPKLTGITDSFHFTCAAFPDDLCLINQYVDTLQKKLLPIMQEVLPSL